MGEYRVPESFARQVAAAQEKKPAAERNPQLAQLETELQQLQQERAQHQGWADDWTPDDQQLDEQAVQRIRDLERRIEELRHSPSA